MRRLGSSRSLEGCGLLSLRDCGRKATRVEDRVSSGELAEAFICDRLHFYYKVYFPYQNLYLNLKFLIKLHRLLGICKFNLRILQISQDLFYFCLRNSDAETKMTHKLLQSKININCFYLDWVTACFALFDFKKFKLKIFWDPNHFFFLYKEVKNPTKLNLIILFLMHRVAEKANEINRFLFRHFT